LDITGPSSAAALLLAELGEIFEGVDLPCIIIGGVAYNFWREPRFTKDIDFSIPANPGLIEVLTQRLIDAGYELTREQGANLASGHDFLRFEQPGTDKMVEFQTAKTPYQDLTIERGVKLDDSQPFAVATPEDLIILKLIANRSKDHTDVVELGKIEDLDWNYIRYWAQIWDVSGGLEGLRRNLQLEEERLADLYS
jgi:hypothetical protein